MQIKYFKTRYINLLYAKIDRGAWSFFHVDPEVDVYGAPAQTGPIYASKLELLTDLQRFATEYGL